MTYVDSMEPTTVSNALANALYSANHCSTLEEAQCVAETIVEDINIATSGQTAIETNDSFQSACAAAVGDYFSLTPEQGLTLVQKALTTSSQHGNTDDEEDSSTDGSPLHDDEIDTGVDETDDSEIIGDGECELCERYIQLTRHHLIPRSTWPRMKTKFQHATDALVTGDERRARLILGPGLEHLLCCLLAENKTAAKQAFQRTCDICRPCHSAVHRAHDNITLANEYNTVEKLLADESVYKFCKWASKQKTGRYARYR